MYFFFIFLSSVAAKNERELYTTIFTNYSKDIRPTKQANQSVIVNFL
ncbi:unnamed protein product [Oikopleura dioica]|uniref:Uncharacterized protein n=1 Tax=Oikopleura dioica TaxID=34765 RepID=E4WWS1_OIKDI|nr:unnamed protein product [Oikopleura dioica]